MFLNADFKCISTVRIVTQPFLFSGELSEGAESPEGEKDKNKPVEGECNPAA